MQIPCESIPIVLWKTLSWRSDLGSQVSGWESECPSSACQLGFSATLSSVESQEAHPLRCRWRPPGSLGDVCGFVSKHFLLRSQDRSWTLRDLQVRTPFLGTQRGPWVMALVPAPSGLEGRCAPCGIPHDPAGEPRGNVPHSRIWALGDSLWRKWIHHCQSPRSRARVGEDRRRAGQALCEPRSRLHSSSQGLECPRVEACAALTTREPVGIKKEDFGLWALGGPFWQQL